jgi:hypothetical protein
MGGQTTPPREFAYNIQSFYIQDIFEFADIPISRADKPELSSESLRSKGLGGILREFPLYRHNDVNRQPIHFHCVEQLLPSVFSSLLTMEQNIVPTTPP